MNPLDPSTQSTEASDKPEAIVEPQKPRRPRGFAAMDRSKVSEIASKGGVAPHVRRGRGPRNTSVSPPNSVEPKEGASE